MEEAWELKHARSPAGVTPRIATLRERALSAGGRAVMLMGAGGGGFLLVYTVDPAATRAALADEAAPELAFDVEPEGCSSRS
jgi:galactokinase/mevalonate kinase-like predicted kinase